MSNSTQSEGSKKQYKRLPGRGLRVSALIVGGDRQALYLGPDHLLALRRSGYDESAKRFFYNDIQAITLQTNGVRTLIAVVTGAVLVIIGILVGLSLNADSEDVFYGAAVVGIIVGVPFLLVFLANLLLGPTCSAFLHTAVQIEPLSALSRVRAARKCMALLAPRIEAAQGVLSQENVAALAAPSSLVRASRNALDAKRQAPPKPLSPGLPRAAYAAMIAFACTTVADLFLRHSVKDFLDLVLFGVLMVLLMVIVVRQTNSTLPAASRRTNWTALIYNSAMFLILMYAFMIAQMIGSDEPPTIVTSFGMANSAEMPRWVTFLSAGLGVMNVFIALFGFASLRGYSVTTRSADPPQST